MLALSIQLQVFRVPDFSKAARGCLRSNRLSLADVEWQVEGGGEETSYFWRVRDEKSKAATLLMVDWALQHAADVYVEVLFDKPLSEDVAEAKRLLQLHAADGMFATGGTMRFLRYNVARIGAFVDMMRGWFEAHPAAGRLAYMPPTAEVRALVVGDRSRPVMWYTIHPRERFPTSTQKARWKGLIREWGLHSEHSSKAKGIDYELCWLRLLGSIELPDGEYRRSYPKHGVGEAWWQMPITSTASALQVYTDVLSVVDYIKRAQRVVHARKKHPGVVPTDEDRAYAEMAPRVRFSIRVRGSLPESRLEELGAQQEGDVLSWDTARVNQTKQKARDELFRQCVYHLFPGEKGLSVASLRLDETAVDAAADERERQRKTQKREQLQAAKAAKAAKAARDAAAWEAEEATRATAPVAVTEVPEPTPFQVLTDEPGWGWG